MEAWTSHPDLQPGDERTALVQRLDQYRVIATAALIDLEWDDASTRLLPATDLTIAGIVKHLAWAEDRRFQGRLRGADMPAPWDTPGADDPDHAMRLTPDDSVDGIVELYSAACREAALQSRLDDRTAPQRRIRCTGHALRRAASPIDDQHSTEPASRTAGRGIRLLSAWLSTIGVRGRDLPDVPSHVSHLPRRPLADRTHSSDTNRSRP